VIPLVHDLTGKRVVIFGGGNVGERKARLFEGEADVTVVSTDFNPGFEELDVNLVRADLSQGFESFLEDAFFVVPATSDTELNREIEEAAERRGTLVNSVEGPGEVIVPSVVDFDEFIVAITTFGKSPAASRFIRQRLEETLGDEMGGMVEIQNRARSLLKKKVPDQAERRKHLRSVIGDEEIWNLLKQGRKEDAWDRTKEILKDAV